MSFQMLCWSEHHKGGDEIGNRTSAKAGGDQTGAGLRSAGYTANTLNQITQRDVPGGIDVIGAARGTVDVNSDSTGVYRRGEYFRKELSLNNSSAALWQSVSVTATDGSTTNQTGNTYLPKTTELFTYDADGNLTGDGRWTYVWDAENRLLSMTAPSSAPSGSRKALHFGYDPKGRRISKTVSNWTGTTWVRALDEKYLYDDWNLLAVLNGTNNALLKSFLWGTDLSGRFEGAGGVGGLLAFKTDAATVAFPAYDANGNVAGLISAADGTEASRYEYAPFGEVIRATGTLGSVNPFRFSTKYQDDETDLVYYGHRYYGTSLGSWLNRDPINELGFIVTGRRSNRTRSPSQEAHQYRFVFNDPMSILDFLGLGEWIFRIEPGDKFWLPGPLVNVSYMLDASQCCSCSAYALRRYARPHFIGAIITGPWVSDGGWGSLGFTAGNCRSQNPAHALDEPGGRLPLVGWVLPYVIDFRWQVICISGPDKGKVLATSEQTIVILGNGGEWVGYPGEDIVHEKD